MPTLHRECYGRAKSFLKKDVVLLMALKKERKKVDVELTLSQKQTKESENSKIYDCISYIVCS